MLSLVALKHIHITLALLSISFFVIRYLGRRLEAGFISWRSARVLPHIIDTLLLVSGISLAWFYRLSPLMAPWLLIKLMLIVVYIILGIAAMRSTQPRTGDLYALASLGTIALVVLLAVFKPVFQGTSI